MISLLLAVVAFAADGPCTADAKKLCPATKPGELMQCLREHQKELSPACRAKAKALGAKK